MTGREAAARWTHFRARWRKKTSSLTPQIISTYPFEILASVLATLMGVPILAGWTESASLVALVGIIAFYAWAVALSIGAVTVAIGLRKLHALALAAGLQLVGGCFLVYAIAVVGVAGWDRGWIAGAAYVLLWLLSWIRASHFRRVVDIQIGVRNPRATS